MNKRTMKKMAKAKQQAAEAAKTAETVVTVSYTHLDVYKRQGKHPPHSRFRLLLLPQSARR